jgi:hypothetical protein
MDDNLWQAETLRKQQEAEAAKTKANQERIAKARAGAVSVKSATPTGTMTTQAKDRRSMLEEQFDSMSGRV